MIELRWNVVMFTFLTVGGLYILYEELRKNFTPPFHTVEEVAITEEGPTGHLGRKLLIVNSNAYEDSLELKTDLNPLIKAEPNDEKVKELSKDFVSYNKLGRNKIRRLSRGKRNTRHNDFGWKINLNVTNKNPSKVASNLAPEDGLSSKSGKEKFLNMAVQMEGASPDDSFKELHKAWDSLGLLLKRLYGRNQSFMENDHGITAEISTELNNIASPDLLTKKPERERSPKFILGLLNFGNGDKPPLEGVVTTLKNEHPSESATSPKPNTEDSTSTKVSSITNADEVPMEASGSEEKISLEPRAVATSETFMDFETTRSAFDMQLTEKFEKTSASSVEITTIKPEPSFTSQQLKEFCISLLSSVQASPKSVDSFSEEDGSGQLDTMGMEVKETTEFQSLITDIPKEMTTKPSNQRFGIWASIWNRLVGRSLVQHPIDVKSTSTPKQDLILKTGKDPANDVFSSKSESSTVPGVTNSSESDKDIFSDEDGSALTVPDCESFFRQIQNDAVFAKPNLLDIINNPSLLSLNPSEFNVPELRDKKMRSMPSETDSNFENDVLFTEEMMSGINAHFSSVEPTSEEREFSLNDLSSEQPNKNTLENTVSNQDPLTTSNSFDAHDSFQSGTSEKSNIGNLITENGKEFRKSENETAFLSDDLTTFRIQSSTKILDDELFNQPGFHTRTDKSSEMPSSEVSTEKDGRVFGIFDFGSGERNLEDSDSLTTQNASEFPKNRFHPDLMNFGSGDSEFNEVFSESEQVITSTDSVTRRSIFDAILNLRKEKNLMTSTESEAFDINEGNNSNESENAISSEKPHTEFQFDPKEKPTESENVSSPSNMPATQSISEDQTLFQNILHENQRTEFQFDHNEKFTESQNVELDSTDMLVTKSSLEDQTSFQNVSDESRIFPGLLNFLGSGDGMESSEIPTDQELNSEFSKCLDCFKNNSSSLLIDEDDGGANTNDVSTTSRPASTEMNPLLNKIDSDTPAYNEIYLGSKVDVFSESDKDQSEFSTFNFPESFIPSATETISYQPYDKAENIGHEATNYEYYDNSKNVGYEENEYQYITENYDNLENIGQEETNYEYYDNSKNIGYEVTDENQYNPGSYTSEYTGYEETNYEYYDNSKNPGYEYQYNTESYGYGTTTLQPPEHVHTEGECDESHFDSKTEALPTTIKGDLRFMDTLFLTGSGGGAGGLFGNDEGEINLVQEPDTTSFPGLHPPVSPRLSRRGGRKDDASFMHDPSTKDHASENHSDAPLPENSSDNPKLNSQNTTADKKALQIPEEESRIGTDSISLLTTPGFIQTAEDGSNNPTVIEETTQIPRGSSSEAATSIRIPTSSFVPKKIAKNLPTRYCNNAGECNIASNEGCITKEGRGVCDCRRSFVRHPETDICEAPFKLKTTLKLPGEVFHEDLRDKNSELYRSKTRDAIETMWLVAYQDPTLEYNLADINVAGFEEGSLVIHWELTFAVRKNANISEIVQEVDEKLEETFKRPAVLESAPLNVENAKLLSFSDVNPCERKELNYCSKRADCIREINHGFRCRCKDGFLDSSKNLLYPGETCIAFCPQDYCGENGYCEMKSSGEKQCLCNGWHFGERCNVSGIFVISCFAGANVVLIILVLATVFFCKRRRQRFYENNNMMFQPNRELGPFGRVSPRLAASIALNELGPTKTSKYMSMSTPMPNIQITSPSVTGSSISYDYDSTFDRTHIIEHGTSTTSKVPEISKV